MDTNGLAFHEHWFKGLNTKPVKRRRTVQEHRVVANDLFENLVHLWRLALDDLFRALHRLGDALLDELVNDERLEQLERHQLGQTALMQLKLGTDDDDRTARVVHALAEQVLTEPALLALEHVGQRLERTLAATANRLRATPVVEQRVHGFLQHALLVAENDLRRAMQDELLQTVVAVDDTPIQIVQVGRRKTTAVQRNEWTQIRRNHRNDVEDHPLRTVARVARLARVAERVDDLEPLEQHLLAMLRRLHRNLRAELFRQLVDVETPEQLAHCGRADVGEERGIAFLLRLRAKIQILFFVEELVDLNILVAGVDDDVIRVVDDLLEITQRDVEQVAHRTGQGLEEPDVRDGNGELDVTHALATHLAQGHFDAAAVADHTAIPDAFVLTAVAFPVLDGTENALAEQAVLFRLERAVVDCFGLRDFTPRPPVAEPLQFQALALLWVLGSADLFRRSNPYLNEVERAGALFAHATEVNHVLLLAPSAVARRPGVDPRSPKAVLALTHGDLDSERLQFFHQHVERLGNAGLRKVLTLHDRLVHSAAAVHVVRLHRQNFLKHVRGAVRLERPDFHLSETLAAELRLAGERLLRHERVRSDGPRVNLVVDEV